MPCCTTGKPRDENFKVLEKAVCMQVEEWTWHVCDLAEDVVGLANGKQMCRRGDTEGVGQ